MQAPVQVLTNELRNRARIYVVIHRELAKELGPDRAAAILKSALYQRGQEKGRQLAARIGDPDLHELAVAFAEGGPDMDAFGHEIVQEHDDYVLLRLNRCPLADAWKESGLTPDEQRTLCDIASQVDFGKFEAAGYKLGFRCRIADGGNSCDLYVTKPETSG